MMNFNQAVNVLRDYAKTELGVQSNGLPEIIEAVQADETDAMDTPMYVRRAYRVVMKDLEALLG